MTVTELARLRLADGANLNDQAFLTKLRTAKLEMEKFTRHEFDYFQEVEDTNVFYIIGTWDSLEQHLGEWIPSQTNQDLLAMLKDDVQLDFLLHVDVLRSSLPLDAPHMAIVRHFMVKRQQTRFTERLDAVKTHLASHTAPYTLGGGWVVDTTPLSQEEFVLFSGWKEVTDHSAFAQTGGFQEYGNIVDHINGSETKHVSKIAL